MADGSVDFVIISETHIADIQIGAGTRWLVSCLHVHACG